jgi:hypothetical protein
MAPVQAFLAEPGASLVPGDQALELRIVNDGPRALKDVTLLVELACDGATEDPAAPDQATAGTVGRVTLARVPTDRAIPVEVPVAVPSGCERVALTLALRWAGGGVENRYALDVRAAGA